MSQFDGLETALNGAVFGLYGDPATITGGPLNASKTPSTTTAVRDVEKVQDVQGIVIAEVVIIEYPRSAWPYPRRGDLITLGGSTWMITEKRNATGTTQIVEVTEQ